MFCPDCGAQNIKSQKFCVRCGSNLLIVDRAREIIGEVGAAGAIRENNSSNAMRMLALISIAGFLCVTVGTIFLVLIDSGQSPVSSIFGVGGFVALILICRMLLRASNTASARNVSTNERIVIPSNPPQITHSGTNRGLGAAVPFQSVTEDSTRQFEGERQSTR